MPATLADGRLRVRFLTTAPAEPGAVTATEANAGEKLECRILKSDFRLSATASDTVADTVLCSEGNATTFGASNYEGSVTVLRYLDGTGAAEVDNDIAWELLKEKGTTGYVVVSEGKHHEEDFVDGDEYDLFEVVTDTPQMPTDRGGFIKRTVPLGVQRAWLNRTIAAA